MLQVSLSEKLQVLKQIMTTSFIPIIALGIILLIGFLFVTTNRHNQKESKKLYLLLYITCIIALIIKFSSSLSDLLDCFINNIFVLIYFPNLAVYLLALIINNIIMWKSMFKSDNKPLKVINTVAFCMIHYLFVLLLFVVSKNHLNLFEVNSIYDSKESLSLIELSSTAFILWILLVIIYKVVEYILTRKKELVLEEIPEESKYNSKSPKSYVSINPPDKVYTQNENKIIENENKRAKEEIEIYEKMLTVEDYKMLLKLLKKYRYKEEIKEEDLNKHSYQEQFATFYKRAK